MRTNSTSKQPGKNKDIVYISILLTIALCTGAYLIATTVIISKDGVTFIEYAKNLTIAPIQTMLNQEQHPGYPFLILISHKILQIVHKDISILAWIYSAQIIALFLRLLTLAALYYAGKKIVGSKFSFLAILILILLPKPARHGSDALSDWPYLFFLTSGFLLLMHGAIDNKCWRFGLAGLAAGLGYLIRPECAQLVVFGFLWTALQLSKGKHIMTRSKAAFALIILLVGFLIPAGPYMKLKGAIFPKKNAGQFGVTINSKDNFEDGKIRSGSVYTAGSAPANIAMALNELIEKTGDTLMWFFLPALLIGAYKYFRQRDWHEPQKFFLAALIALNIPLLIWLYCKFGYISNRHTLSLVVLLIFFVPSGLQVLGNWLPAFFSKNRLKAGQDLHLWFFILLISGLALCVPKLLTPLHADKHSYRQAAQWLAKHTEPKDVIAAPDVRIGFYAQRPCLEWTAGQIPDQARYAVKIFTEKSKADTSEYSGEEEYRYVDKRNAKAGFIIYKKSP